MKKAGAVIRSGNIGFIAEIYNLETVAYLRFHKRGGGKFLLATIAYTKGGQTSISYFYYGKKTVFHIFSMANKFFFKGEGQVSILFQFVCLRRLNV